MVGSSSRRLGLAHSFGVGLATGSADAQSTTADPARPRMAARSTDRTGNGRINREEFHQCATERFYFLDKARKGVVTLDEVRDVMGPEAFTVANRKKDGQLTLREFVNAVFKDFEAADVDKDGTLTF